MRLFDDDRIGCYLDAIDHRVEKTPDGKEIKMIDLTLRVQPFTPALALSLNAEVRALLFTLTDATPKPTIKAVEFRLPCPRQVLDVFLLPEGDTPQLRLQDIEISGPRARTEKGVDGYGFVFYASFGPASARELEYVCGWHTQQRFITFHPVQPSLLDGLHGPGLQLLAPVEA
jgi:hypothetical protein